MPAASLEDYADDVHALLTRLSFAPCAVAGFAMGGMVTQALAVKYPQDTRALMIASCAHAQTPESRDALLSRAASARRDGFAKILDETMQRWFTDGFIARGGDAAVRRRLLDDDVDAWVNAFDAMAAIDTAPRLKNIKVPTLCLVGDADKSTPPPVVKAIADAIPGARFAVHSRAARTCRSSRSRSRSRRWWAGFSRRCSVTPASPLQGGRSTREARSGGARRVGTTPTRPRLRRGHPPRFAGRA